MNALYTGHVAHMRPGKHRLRYPVFMLTLDLDPPIMPSSVTRRSSRKSKLNSATPAFHGTAAASSC
jgi:DUF1365 family protein